MPVTFYVIQEKCKNIFTTHGRARANLYSTQSGRASKLNVEQYGWANTWRFVEDVVKVLVGDRPPVRLATVVWLQLHADLSVDKRL